MKKTKLQSTTYQLYEKSFENWLKTLNYAESTVNTSPLYVREFFWFLEQKHTYKIEQIKKTDIENYFRYLGKRKNERTGGGLSLNYLHGHLTAIKRFAHYLRATRHKNLPVSVELPKPTGLEKNIFTREEIKKLYESTYETTRQLSLNILGFRDRAMLSVYYGCGLRRSEGAALNVSDILFDKSLIYVRKGKNYTERYVPMTSQVKNDLQAYLMQSRPFLLKPNKTETKSLFLGFRGTRMIANSMNQRFSLLIKRSGINRQTGLHTLRHSIATHLLQSGMKLEQVSAFLGHASLETTQIYTHLACENEN